MAGAEDLSIDDNPLLAAVATRLTRDAVVTYAFELGGEAVDKSGYSGGSDRTRDWTTAEKEAFRSHIQAFSDVALISFVERSSTTMADIHLQMVDAVPGGWAGYAGTGTTFVVKNAASALITHEFGHSMGLAHPFDTSFSSQALPGVSGSSDPGDFGFNSDFYTILAYRADAVAEYPDADVSPVESLRPLDIAALQVMYGANTEHRTGDDTYSAVRSSETIWDAGGRDTLDFSALNTDAILDLRAATLQAEAGGLGWASLTDRSTGATDVGSYLIAYGVTIEDALGGAGDDILRGNAVGNLLDAGMGNDTLRGGAGDDTLRGGPTQAETIALAQMNDGSTRDRALESDFAGMPASVTIDMVLRLDPTTEDYQRIFSYEADDAGGYGFDIQYFNADDTQYLTMIYRTDSGYRTAWAGIRGHELDDGELHRLTVSRDHVTGEFVTYLDGVFQARDTIAPDAGRAMSATGRLVFGQSQGAWVPENSGTAAFNGAFGAIAIYAGASGSGTIEDRPLNALADPADPGLVAYWTPDPVTGGYDRQAGTSDLSLRNDVTVDDVPVAGDDDLLIGGAGDDSILGGAGTDIAQIDAASTGVLVRTVDGGIEVVSTDGTDFVAADVEWLRFTDGDVAYADIAFTPAPIDGDEGSNTLYGTAGGEEINGYGGYDWIVPGRGDDTVDGGSERDMVSYSDQPEVSGRTGLDFMLDLDLGAGTAELFGGETDVLRNIERVTGTIFADVLRGSAGDDELRGIGDYDWFIATAGNDTLDGGNGQDMVTFLEWGGTGAAVVEDVFAGAPPTGAAVGGVLLDLANPGNSTGLAAGLTLVSVERVTGSSYQDVFYGDDQQNDFRGLGGYDWFVGSTGGRERYFGGDGLDTVTYYQSTSGVTASLRNGNGLFNGQETGYGSTGDAVRDLYFEIENLVGTQHRDRLEGNSERNQLAGLGDDDFLYGYGGTDYIEGGDGNDYIDGGAGSDFALYAGARSDYTITRTSATDVTITGEGFTDTLTNVEYFRFDDADANIWELEFV